jgi:hypothetical protein
VKSSLEGDDFVRAVLMQRAVFARELDGAFIRLRAGIGKEHPVKAALFDQRLRQLQAYVVVKGGAWRDQPLGLAGEGVRHDLR